MAYVVNALPFDATPGALISGGSTLSGTFTNVSPTPAVEVTTGTGMPQLTTSFVLSFATATPPPPGFGTAKLFVNNTGPTGGDIFRSGPLSGFPPSPARLTVWAFNARPVTNADLAAFLPRALPFSITPPGWVIALITAMSGGMFVPTGGAITALTPTIGVPAGSITLTASGFFTVLVALQPQVILMTGTIVATPAPSGDVDRVERILSISFSTSLSAAPIGSSAGLFFTSMFLNLLSPLIGPMIQPTLEGVLNRLVTSLADRALATFMGGRVRTNSSVISARRITMRVGSMTASVTIADLFGEAISASTKAFNVTVTPTPQNDGIRRDYSVSVTEAGTSEAVPDAQVTLHNFDADGSPLDNGPASTNASGQVVFSVELRTKRLSVRIPEEETATTISVHPAITVSKAGFTAITTRL